MNRPLETFKEEPSVFVRNQKLVLVLSRVGVGGPSVEDEEQDVRAVFEGRAERTSARHYNDRKPTVRLGDVVLHGSLVGVRLAVFEGDGRPQLFEAAQAEPVGEGGE